MYRRSIGLESDTRSYFTIITIFISLPTGTKIYNWLSTYLSNNLFLLKLKLHINLFINNSLYIYLFLLMFTIGGSTGIILGNSAITFLGDLGSISHNFQDLVSFM